MKKQLTKKYVMAVLAASCFTISASVVAQEQRSVVLQQNPVAQIQTNESNLKISVWGFNPNRNYAPGENLKLNFSTTQDAYISILNIDANGNTNVLFPNRYEPDNFVRANQINTFPSPNSNYQVTIRPPFGQNMIKIIANTERNPNLTSLGRFLRDDSSPFSTYKGASDELARSVVITMNQTPSQWHVQDHVFNVVSSQPKPAPTVVSSQAQHNQGLQLFLDKKIYRVGEHFSLRVTSTRSCDLVLANTNHSNGETLVLYPNQNIARVRLQAGEITRLPGADSTFAFRVSEPIGHQTITALCATNQQALASILNQPNRQAIHSVYSQDQWQQFTANQILRATEHFNVVR